MLRPRPYTFRYQAAGLLSLGLLGASACRPEPSPDGYPSGTSPTAALLGTWLLDPDASRADTLVYRPNTYRFRYRPAGRPGFRLGPGGRFTRYVVAPGGGLLAQDGTWTLSGPSQLRIELSAGARYEWQLLALAKGQLKLREQLVR